MTAPTLLDAHALTQALCGLNDWHLEHPAPQALGNALLARFALTRYADGLAAVARIGALAEATGHHPDLTLVWGALSVRYTTHEAGGITERDILAAQAVSRLMADNSPA